MDIGFLNPFTFYTKKSDCTATYNLPKLAFVLRGSPTLKKVDVKTGSESFISSIGQTTYTLNGVSYTNTIFSFTLQPTDEFYIKSEIDGRTYYDGVFKYASDDCYTLLNVSKDCDDENFKWTAPDSTLDIYLKGEFDVPEFKSTEIVSVSDSVEKESTVDLREVQKFVFTAPKGYFSYLSGLKIMDTIIFGGKEVINWNIEKADFDSDHYTYSASFSYPIKSNDSCCETINIDDVAAPSVNGLTVSITNNGGILTPNVTGDDVTGLVYNWYKNGVLLANTETLQIDGSGNYTVEVANDSGTGEATTSLANECSAIVIEPFQAGNDISANILNAPDGYSLSVTKGGVEVATSVPYTITESGVYYIEVITPNCSRVAAIDATYSDPTALFTIGITRSGDTLTATTDASSPTYLWEFEATQGNVSTIGSGVSVNMVAGGLYHLTITQSGVSKTEYYLFSNDEVASVNVLNISDLNANPYRLVDSYINASGYQFAPTQIDVTKVNNPSIQLTVTRGMNVLNYVSVNPANVDEYTINGSNQYEIWSEIPLAGEDLIIKIN